MQSRLADILGYEDLDLVADIIKHRKDVIKRPKRRPRADESPPDTPARLLTKAERQEILKQRDEEHKTRELGPKLVSAETEYPHVYRAHSAGNTLNAFGKKYALPAGTERVEHDVCAVLGKMASGLIMCKHLLDLPEIRRNQNTTHQSWHSWSWSIVDTNQVTRQSL